MADRPFLVTDRPNPITNGLYLITDQLYLITDQPNPIMDPTNRVTNKVFSRADRVIHVEDRAIREADRLIRDPDRVIRVPNAGLGAAGLAISLTRGPPFGETTAAPEPVKRCVCRAAAGSVCCRLSGLWLAHAGSLPGQTPHAIAAMPNQTSGVRAAALHVSVLDCSGASVCGS